MAAAAVASSAAPHGTSGELHDEHACWICLCGPEDGNELLRACDCPSALVHRPCLARWQLQKAGQSEETRCRFCDGTYPDWRAAMTPQELSPGSPVMAVSVRGRVHKLRVRPGPEGAAQFKAEVRALLGYSESEEFDVVFECKTPLGGEKVQLCGFSAFEAATHCAAVSAARRRARKEAAAAAARAHAAAATAAGGGALASAGPSCPLPATGSPGASSSSCSSSVLYSSNGAVPASPRAVTSHAPPAPSWQDRWLGQMRAQAEAAAALSDAAAGSARAASPAGGALVSVRSEPVPGAPRVPAALQAQPSSSSDGSAFALAASRASSLAGEPGGDAASGRGLGLGERKASPALARQGSSGSWWQRWLCLHPDDA